MPPMSTNFETTWLTTQPSPGTNLASYVPLSTGVSKDGQGIGMDISDALFNQFPREAEHDVLGKLVSGAWPDAAQLKFGEGDIIFTYLPQRDIGKPQTTMSLWYLNYTLEMAHSRKSENRTAQDRTDGPPSKRTKAMRDPGGGFENMYSNFPTMVEDYVREVHHVGFVATFMDRANTKQRILNIKYQGKMSNVPNIWGEVSVADAIGLVAKAVHNEKNSKTDWKGELLDKDPTKGPFLQVIGYAESQTRNPIHCSRRGNPADGDLDFYEERVIRQTIFEGVNNLHRDGSVVLDWDSQPEEEYIPMRAKVYTTGHYVRLGTVKKVTGRKPTRDEISSALTSYAGWLKLKSISSVDIEI